jgi:hypothetical protein
LINEDHLIDFYQEKYQVVVTLHSCPSSTGDTCHIDIMGIPKNKTDKYTKEAEPPNIFVCGQNKLISTQDELDSILTTMINNLV